MKDREAAARVLHKAGWQTCEIANVLRWKYEHAERVLNRKPYKSETPISDNMGLELSRRAAKAVEMLGVTTAAELLINLPCLQQMRGVGPKTAAEIERELRRLPAILLI
jgi:hypothetical protein